MNYTNKKNYSKLLFLFFTTNLLIKKTNTEQQHKQNIEYRLNMINKIDTILTTKHQSSIEPRQQLHTKIPIHQELQFITTSTKTPPTPQEFQNDNFITPKSYTFIKELPQTPLQQTKKTVRTPHIEIINLTELSQQPSIHKKTTPTTPYLTVSNIQKPQTNTTTTSQSQQKNNIYYLKSKYLQNKKTTKQEKDPCYIPINFQEKKQQTKTTKIPKQTLKIKFNKNKQKNKQKKKQEKQELIQKLLKEKQQKQQKKQKNSLFTLKKPKKESSQQKNTSTTHHNYAADKDIIKVLLLTDELLGKLPEKVINEFVQSDDFKLYEKVLSKYKTM